ncbi:MAG: hypothetical protein LAO05_05365 [Acidobacteriia bacterium]|nr:hypothetical protein [Terriglobia bacterium]
MTSRLLTLRRLSVIVLVLWSGVVIGSFLERHFRHQTQTEIVEVEAPPKEGQEQPVRVHKGFVYSDTLGIEPNFRISAREAVEFSNGWYEFRSVQVSLYHQGRVAYGLVSDTLRFDPARHEAKTGGEAEVSLQGGVALRAGGFTLGGPERLIESRGPATFAGPGWGGLAGGAVCSMQKNTLELVGGVSIVWRGQTPSAEPSLVLLAPSMAYDRNQAAIHFNNGLTVLRGRLRARTGRAELQLSSPESELRRATLEAPVRLDGILDDGSDVAATAGTTVIESLPDGRYRLTAEPAPGVGWVSANWADRSGQWRDFLAWWIVGEGSQSAWEWLEGQGLTCAADIARGADPRTIGADRMRLSFEGGQAATVLASDEVRIETGDQWAEGSELELSLRTRTFNLRPSPGKRVALGGQGGLSWCDRLEGSEGGGVTARGQVTGTLQGEGTPRKGAAPIQFAAATAGSSDGGARLSLEGEARLWQGDRVVRADRLDFDRPEDIVTGEGGVFTTAHAAPKNGTPGTVEVRARHLRYDRGAGVATYEGDVRLDDQQAQASCQSLQANLDANGNIVMADLDGGVTITDRVSARVISGQKARLMVGEGLFEIWGKPVLVKEANGNQVKADHLLWHRDVNTVVVLGAEDNPSETLYHSQQAGPTPAPRRRKP